MTRWKRIESRAKGLVTLVFLVALVAAPTPSPGAGSPEEDVDRAFDPRVSSPAYVDSHPVVLFDEAHHNYHTADGRYRPLADLLRSDGYDVRRNRARLTKEAIEKASVLVVAGAMGDDERGAAAAFTGEEVGIVAEWVRDGGGLLLVTDHFPFATSVENLAKTFGVGMGGGIVEDPDRSDPSFDPSHILYVREAGLAGGHPITEGRRGNERVRRVLTFTGQSLAGPSGSVSFLRLGDASKEAQPSVSVSYRGSDTIVSVEYGDPVGVAGRSQGLALEVGRGRAVVLGDAAMLTAQVAGGGRRFGMNVPGFDDRQLALNIAHWLSGLLPAGSEPAADY